MKDKKLSRKALRNRYRKGNEHGRAITDELGMPVSFRQWLRIIGMAGFLLMLAGCFGDPEAAKASARQYAKDLGYEVAGVSCTGVDSDGDGYVSCTVRLKDPDPSGSSLLALECSRGEVTFTSGCKVAPLVKNKTTNVNRQ